MEKLPKLHPVFPILLVDDEIHTLRLYKMQLEGEGFTNLISCQNGKDALAVLSSKEVSLIVLDLHMPKMSGEEVLSVVAGTYPDLPVIITTAVDNVETVVRCMKTGAFDYIVKPVAPTRFMTTVKRALEVRELRRENILLKEQVLDGTLRYPEAFSEIITDDPKMLSIFKYIESIAITTQPVLITGETGVGKELIARAIHHLSDRTGELVAVNVAGLDDTTFSDILFGHKRGAFTGADRARDGLIEKAANGTLFLDEIGDLALTSQVKLLRLLQEREYYQLGADVPNSTNARILVATNRNLVALQEAEKFRADLYYRLLLHHIDIPALRERQDDIPLLVESFLKSAAKELGKARPTPPPELFTLLSVYDFPGNIRELKAMIFDAVSHHTSGKLSLTRFKKYIQPSLVAALPQSAPPGSRFDTLCGSLDRLPTLKEAEDMLIQEALKRTNGNQTQAAMLLGTTRRTLHRRLRLKKPL